MKRCATFLLFCFMSALLISCGLPNHNTETPAAYTVTDIEGTVVAFPAPPQRIVTLSMGTDQTMHGLVEP